MPVRRNGGRFTPFSEFPRWHMLLSLTYPRLPVGTPWQGLGRKVRQVSYTCSSLFKAAPTPFNPHPRPVVCMFGRKLCLPIWLQAIGYKNWQMRAKKLDSDSPNWLLCENLSLSKNADCFVLVIYLKRGEKIWQHHFNVSTRFFFFFQFTDLSYLFG